MASYGIPIRVRWRAVSTEPVPSSAAADGITARPRHGDAEVVVVAAMKANRFFAGGLGYWDYYSGYGLMAAAVRIVEAVLCWQIETAAETQPLLVRPMLILLAVANVGHQFASSCRRIA